MPLQPLSMFAHNIHVRGHLSGLPWVSDKVGALKPFKPLFTYKKKLQSANLVNHRRRPTQVPTLSVRMQYKLCQEWSVCGCNEHSLRDMQQIYFLI